MGSINLKIKISICSIICFLVTLQYASANVSERVFGSNSYQTAIAVSQKGWPSSNKVILATYEDFPDALAGTVLSIQYNAPILYTDKDNLNTETLDEIIRLKANTVYILGGPGAISQNIESIIKDKGIQVKRLYGKDRFETAVAVGEEMMSSKLKTAAVLVYSEDFPDALSVATFAGEEGYPILLTNKYYLNDDTLKALLDWRIKKVYIIGGLGVIPQEIEDKLQSYNITTDRICGIDRYYTSLEVIKAFYNSPDKITIATGNDFHEALVGSSYGAKIKSPLMLYDNNASNVIKEFVKDKSLVIVGNDISEESFKIVPDRIRQLEEDAEKEKLYIPFVRIEPSRIITPSGGLIPVVPIKGTELKGLLNIENTPYAINKTITSLTDEDIQRLQNYPVIQTKVETDFKTMYETQKEECEALIKMFSPVHLYTNAKVRWVTDPRLVYYSYIGQYCVRGILELTYYRQPNLFNLEPEQKYQREVEYRLTYGYNLTEEDHLTPHLKLNNTIWLSDFVKVLD